MTTANTKASKRVLLIYQDKHCNNAITVAWCENEKQADKFAKGACPDGERLEYVILEGVTDYVEREVDKT